MKKKIFILITTLMIITTSYITILNDFEVKATPGGDGDGEEDDIGLDFNWMWDSVIKTMCNATYIPYNGQKILRGREFGTIGEYWAAEKIESYMLSCGLKKVKKLPLGPIDGCDHRYYTSRMNVTDYLLHINISSENYDHDIPVNESYVIPMTRPENPGTWYLEDNLDFTWNLPAEDEIIVILRPSDNFPAGGSLTNYTSHYNLSIDPINDFNILIGNATYIENGENLSTVQYDRVFLFDEEDGVKDQLNDTTNATGVLLIYNNTKGAEKVSKADAADYNFSICRVNSTGSNWTFVSELLNNNELMIVDNLIDNTTLTFTFNLSDACIPTSDYVILHYNGKRCGFIWDYFYYTWNYLCDFMCDLGICDLGKCKGIISYQNAFDSDQERRSHYMNAAVLGGLYNAWFRYDNWRALHNWSIGEGNYSRWSVLAEPSLPTFYVNYSIGNLLYENRSEALISGYECQELLEEKHSGNGTAGVEAYNVIGNLTIDGSDNPLDPDDPTVLVSNRYDGWWCEAPFDSGCGTGVVLAIAKSVSYTHLTLPTN